MAVAEDYRKVVLTSYNRLAGPYSESFANTESAHPLDRAMVTAFAELVLDHGGGRVADLGCGPGHWSAYLDAAGVDVVGIDLAEEFIEIARELHPKLDFVVGPMTELDVPSGSLSGALAWYSLIHTPPDELLDELRRIRGLLKPNASMLVGFQVTEDDEPVTPHAHQVAPAYRWSVDALAALLVDAGLVEVSRQVRQPTWRETSRQGYLLVRAM